MLSIKTHTHWIEYVILHISPESIYDRKYKKIDVFWLLGNVLFKSHSPHQIYIFNILSRSLSVYWTYKTEFYFYFPTQIARYVYRQIDEKSVWFYLHFDITQARYDQLIGLETTYTGYILEICVTFGVCFEFLTLTVFDI